VENPPVQKKKANLFHFARWTNKMGNSKQANIQNY
jgi:hypothetical protein